MLSSVVLSPLAERQKIKNIRSYKKNEKGNLLNYKIKFLQLKNTLVPSEVIVSGIVTLVS